MLHDSYFTLAFFVRKNRPLRNGELPIFARITVSGQQSELYIGRSVAPELWDQKRNVATGRAKKELELNKYLENIRTRFNEIHNMLLRENKLVNPKVLRDHYLGTVEKPKMLCDVFREVNKQRKEEFERGDICAATLGRWERCVTYLEEFMELTQNTKDIPIKEVSRGFIQDFEHFLRMTKQTANNTTVRYLRYLKNVMQYAMAHKWVSEDPFVGKRFKRTVAEREFLTEPELQAMMNVDLHEFPRLETVRDTFVFCCFTGLAFADISTLKREHVVTDDKGEMWIRKAREKTDEMSVIPMLEIPRRLMDKYRTHPRVVEKDAVIPVISNQRMNSYLDEIASKAEIKKHLTTHIARHTFATMSLNNHVPIETVSKMLGHKDIATTQIYATMLDQTVSEDMGRMRDKFDSLKVDIKPLPEKPTTFERPPQPKRGRPKKTK